jgi:hypothetical protein
MVRLWAGRPRDQVSFSGEDKTFVSPPRLPDRLWDLPRLLFRWARSVRQSEYETKHSSSSSAKGKHKLVYDSTSTVPS